MSAQTPDYIWIGHIEPIPIKTASEFNRRVAKCLDKPLTMEKGEITVADAIAQVAKKTGARIRAAQWEFYDSGMREVKVLETKVTIRNKLVGVSGRTTLRLICEQIDAAIWVADDQVVLVPVGRHLSRVIYETISAGQPVDPTLLQIYVDELLVAVKEKNRMALMIEALSTPIDVSEMKKPLKEVLALLRTKYKINIVCDLSLTKKMLAADPLETAIVLPALNGVRLDSLLWIIARQGELGFKVRPDRIEFFKARNQEGERIGPADRVHVAFDNTSLSKVVDELTEQTGASILMKLPDSVRRRSVTLTTLDEPIEKVLRLVALQLDIDLELSDGALVLKAKDQSSVKPRERAK